MLALDDVAQRKRAVDADSLHCNLLWELHVYLRLSAGMHGTITVYMFTAKRSVLL